MDIILMILNRTSHSNVAHHKINTQSTSISAN
jgi:hypothetical protein